MSSKSPKWLTPERKAHLIDLFHRSRGFCVFGHSLCQYPEHHYQLFIEDLIKYWISEDKAQRLAEWRAELRQIHSLGERKEPLRGRFNTISRDIFFDQQPLYYVLGFGISGLTLKPFAKVRMSSSYVVLYVELDRLTNVSKSRKRKALRYGKSSTEIDNTIREAVKDYLK